MGRSDAFSNSSEGINSLRREYPNPLSQRIINAYNRGRHIGLQDRRESVKAGRIQPATSDDRLFLSTVQRVTG